MNKKEYNHQWYLKNRERVLKETKEKFKNHPEIRERKRQYGKKHYLEHKDQYYLQNKKWRLNNPEKYKEIQRRSWKKQIRKSIKYRTIIINTLGNKCQLCGSIENLEIHEKNKFHRDITIEECQLLCRKCHRTKIHNFRL